MSKRIIHFKPKEDITTYELAEIVKDLVEFKKWSAKPFKDDLKSGKISEKIKRHFMIEEY